METRVVNIYKEECDIYIGRGKGSQFGNPYSTKVSTLAKFKVETKDEAIQKYKEMWLNRLEKNPEHTKKILLKLKGKKLGCFCKPKACHGDVLVELINSLEV